MNVFLKFKDKGRKQKMKKDKRYLRALLISLASILLAFGAGACDTQNAGFSSIDGGQTLNCEEVGHDFVVDEENSIPATCDTDGVLVEKCKRNNCDTMQESPVPAYGHTYVEGECDCGEREYPDIAEFLKYTLNEDGASYSVSFWESAEEAQRSSTLDVLEFYTLYPQAEVRGLFKLPAEYKELPVTEIADFGFAYFSFEEIRLPSTLRKVGNGAFKDCDLKSVVLPDSVTEIGCSAFEDCAYLEKVTLPVSLTDIQEKTFQNCSVLTEIDLPQGLETIGDYAFSCALESVTIPDSTTSIGDYAFFGSALESVVIPDSTTSIGVYAFSRSTALKRATLGLGITEIAEGVFEFCESLADVEMRGEITTIGVSALRFCYGLTEVTIPASVNTIGNFAFEGCQNLTKLTCENNVRTIGDFSFYSCPIKEARVAMKLISYIGKRGLEKVTITSGTNLLADTFKDCTSLTSVIFESDVTKIGNSAFEYCVNLTNVEFPASLTTIGSRAFLSTGLTEVTIPASVTMIQGYAFAHCDNLGRITIGENVEYIGENAFYKDSKAEVVFQNTEGWVISPNDSAKDGTQINGTELQSSAVSAYLTDTYAEYYWLRVKEKV